MAVPETRAAALRAVIRNRSLRRVVAGYWFFAVSEYAVWAAFLYFAYSRGGPSESSAVALLQLIPAAALAPAIATLTDRYRPTSVLTWGLVVQAGSLALAAGAMAAGAPPAVWLLGAVVDAVAVTSTRPAQIAVLPCASCSAPELAAAAVVLGWTETLGTIASGLLVGVLLAVSSASTVVAACAGSALVGAVLVRTLPSLPVAISADVGGPVAALVDGARALMGAPAARLLVALSTASYVVVGALDVLLAVLAVGHLHAGPAWVGYLDTAFGLGGVAAAAGTLRLVGRSLSGPVLASAGLLSLGIALSAFSGSLALTFGLLAAAGLGRSVLKVVTSMLLQRTVDPHRLGRIFGLVEGLSMAGLALGAVLVPLLMSVGGITAATVGVGAVLPVVALLGGRRTWHLDDGTVRPVVEIRLLRSLEHFRPLPSPQLERLAAAAQRLEAAAGTAIVRQGDNGAEFFVLASGEAEVLVDGRAVNHLQAGAAFGEVAVLRSVPRTATVVATTPTEVYRIDGTALLPVLSGHTASWSSADRVAEGHLADDRARTER